MFHLLLDDPEKSLGWNFRGKEDNSDSFTDVQFEKIPFPLALHLWHLWNGRKEKGLDLLGRTFLLSVFVNIAIQMSVFYHAHLNLDDAEDAVLLFS